jgi:hypothetical protein
VSGREKVAIRELPELLPPGEHLLWQGKPAWKSLARRAFHVDKVALYFAILLVVQIAIDRSQMSHLTSLVLATLGLVAVAILTFFAWANAHTTLYSITNRRIVMRIGVALPICLNVPFCKIGKAALKCFADGSGDIPVELATTDRFAYLTLWPHAKPWRLARPEPMLRCVPDAKSVAEVLVGALAESGDARARTPNNVTELPARREMTVQHLTAAE